MEALLATLHVVGAVFIVGPMAILPMTAMRAIRAGQGAQVAVLAKSTFVFSLLSLLVAVLGFGILGVSGQDEKHATISTPWVLVSIILYAVAARPDPDRGRPRAAERRRAPAGPGRPGPEVGRLPAHRDRLRGGHRAARGRRGADGLEAGRMTHVARISR